MEDIAITGYGALLPEAEDAETFWQNVIAARCAIREIPSEIWDRTLYCSADPAEPDTSASASAGFIDETMLARTARRLGLSRERFNRLQIMTLAAAEEALAPLRPV